MDTGFKLIQSLSVLNMFYQLLTVAFRSLNSPLFKMNQLNPIINIHPDDQTVYQISQCVIQTVSSLHHLHLHPNSEADQIYINNPSVFPTMHHSFHWEMGSCSFPWDLGELVAVEFPRDITLYSTASMRLSWDVNTWNSSQTKGKGTPAERH